MFEKNELQWLAHGQENADLVGKKLKRDAPATMKFWGVVTLILVAAWAVDQVLITLQDWYAAIFG